MPMRLEGSCRCGAITAVAKPQIDLSCKERVRQAMRRHLRTPTLEPMTLSRLVGMSCSNLYHLLEKEGGIARYIQHQRLLEAQAVLSDPATTASISAIAEDLCFADASSVSRTFKREFGYSPSAARAAALAGHKPPVPRSISASLRLGSIAPTALSVISSWIAKILSSERS